VGNRVRRPEDDDWNSLLRERNDYYESGAFDIRAPTPRKTAIGKAIQCLSETGKYDHPVLDTEGWWRRPDRYQVPASRSVTRRDESKARILLVIGAGGVANAVCQVCKHRGLAHVRLLTSEWSTLSPAMLASLSPWALVDASIGAKQLSRTQRSQITEVGSLCSRFRLPLLFFSSDRVFNGLSERPYDEYDSPRPLDVFGIALASIEQQLLAIHPGTLIARSGPILDAADPNSFGIRLLSKITSGHLQRVSNVIISPAYVPDLINGALDLLIDGERGFWHLANRGQLSILELAIRLADEAGLGAMNTSQVSKNGSRSFALTSRRGWITPTIHSAISRFSRACNLRAIAADASAEVVHGSMPELDYLAADKD
jgi:dTDP-4-dehydrorhamnose reductase